MIRRLRALAGRVPPLRACASFSRRNAACARARARRGNRIVLVGDSHLGVLTGQPGCLLLPVGPATLHRLGRPAELVRLLKKEIRGLPVLWWPGRRIGAHDVVLVSAGEVDARCHISKQVEQGRDEEEVIHQLASGITVACSRVEEHFGCRSGILAVPPPVRSFEHIKDHPGALEFPIRGIFKDRVRWTNHLNQELARMSAQTGHLFIGLPKGVEGPDGELRTDCSDGTIHLNVRFGPSLVSQICAARAAVGPVQRRPAFVRTGG